MDKYTLILILGILCTVFGLLSLSSDRFVEFVSRIAWQPSNKWRLSPEDIEENSRFQGLVGIIMGIFLLALWLLL
jgi:hypothetical protein